MHTLRRTRWLTCLVLAWFSAMLGVATASPLVGAPTLFVVCSSAGEVKWVTSADDAVALHPQGLECPLCLPIAAGPPAGAPGRRLQFAVPQLEAPVLLPAHVAPRTAAPLPARGPPSRQALI